MVSLVKLKYNTVDGGATTIQVIDLFFFAFHSLWNIREWPSQLGWAILVFYVKPQNYYLNT